MKRINPDFLTRPEVRAIFAALPDYQTYIVGGAVRDYLLGREVYDIDFATSALPEDVMRAGKAASFGAVPTGLAHGTLTLTRKGHGFQITTFRRDTKTDGRHAIVRFSDSLQEDALRRDFTINALYLAADGELIDPVGGLRDLEKKRLRFVGSAHQRIAEDALRVLRYFRFFAYLGLSIKASDPELLNALSAAKDTLAVLSKERIHAEMLALLSQPDPGPALELMSQTHLLARILPAADISLIAPLVALEQKHALKADSLTRLAALSRNTDAHALDNLHLSRFEQRRLLQLSRVWTENMTAIEAAYRFGKDLALGHALLDAAQKQAELPDDILAQLENATRQVFPLKASDLSPHLKGVKLGEKLRGAENAWIASGFSLSRDALLKSSRQDNEISDFPKL